ncbi:MAG: DUF6695 family protein [Bacteroidota bacterium]
MKHKKSDKTGIVIALAWPQTWCRQANSWYDPILYFAGINKNHFYRAGHSALVLIKKETGKCYYFDFGRYHAPFNYGRVRSAFTDHDLTIPFCAKLSDNEKTISNYEEILHFLQKNISCHGNGNLYASYSEINFEAAFAKAKEMQNKSPIIYGPFIKGGTNCSRFTYSVIRAGKPPLKNLWRLKYLMPFTPSPMSNVYALDHQKTITLLQPWEQFYPKKRLSIKERSSTLTIPARPSSIPEKSVWIAGEGAGSWFHIEKISRNLYHITRYAVDGMIECKSDFELEGTHELNIHKDFSLDYLSHCQQVIAIQDQKKFLFKRLLSKANKIPKHTYVKAEN